jgi:hypothetical protein
LASSSRGRPRRPQPLLANSSVASLSRIAEPAPAELRTSRETTDFPGISLGFAMDDTSRLA